MYLLLCILFVRDPCIAWFIQINLLGAGLMTAAVEWTVREALIESWCVQRVGEGDSRERPSGSWFEPPLFVYPHIVQANESIKGN